MPKIETITVKDKKIIIGSSTYTPEEFIEYINAGLYESRVSDDAHICFMECDTVHAGGFNEIVYGVPGCGKSYYVINTLIPKIVGDSETHKVFSTTFHPDYTNTDFIGQVIPKTCDGDITYAFNPGPFTLALEYALCRRDSPVILDIEEINRGNAPAIFGDLFQLLDRDETGNSQYSTINKSIIDYFNDNKILPYKMESVRIPPNLYIVATMNTSDQNVFTLDNAFKRRWVMHRYPNDMSKCTYGDWYVPGSKKLTWAMLVTGLNKLMSDNPDLFLNEDKQVGAFYLDSRCLISPDDLDNLNPENEVLCSRCILFADKLLEYLWNDALRNEEKGIFFPGIGSYDELLMTFFDKSKSMNAEEIFNPKIWRIDATK